MLIIHKSISDYKIRIGDNSFWISKSKLLMNIFVKFTGCAINGYSGKNNNSQIIIIIIINFCLTKQICLLWWFIVFFLGLSEMQTRKGVTIYTYVCHNTENILLWKLESLLLNISWFGFWPSKYIYFLKYSRNWYREKSRKTIFKWSNSCQNITPKRGHSSISHPSHSLYIKPINCQSISPPPRHIIWSHHTTPIHHLIVHWLGRQI